ncbi:hypothetical protein [Paenibacillus physcomitrellae]|uniref:Uncharacterized protein n=1 Tax=Paenibacillus physcomitrellae TaxID=1619311 RepID=A0ABQ1FPQ5_9BACL|nr:hypothetical protein [Paenibacillus physcomitrellae]GGA24337.1 hypothetical protein GCM10010917_06470 [Paenibacillus physcomitrellae]
MLYVELIVVFLSLIGLFKIHTLERKNTLIAWMFGVVVNELFMVVSNHAVIKRPYNWTTLWPYLVYFNLMNPLLMLVAVHLIHIQTGWYRKAGVALLSSLVLTAGIYLFYSNRMLHPQSVQPLVAVVLWLFGLTSMLGLVRYLSHSSKR